MNTSAALLCEGACSDMRWTFATLTVVQSNKLNMSKNVSRQFTCLYTKFSGQSLTYFCPVPTGTLPDYFWTQHRTCRRGEPLPRRSLNATTCLTLGELSNVASGPPISISLKTMERSRVRAIFNTDTVSLSDLELPFIKNWDAILNQYRFMCQCGQGRLHQMQYQYFKRV